MIAIDPGTKNVGVAVDYPFQYTTFTKEGYGKSGVKDMVSRVVDFIKSTGDRHIVFEDYAHGDFFNKEEAEVMGMFYALLNGFSITLISITANKKIVTGNGKATKSQMMKAVREHYKIDSKIDHECDALGLLMSAKELDLSDKTFEI